jgi:hypothetical protein
MGHEATGRSGQQRGSAMGAHYRHTTPEMAARVVDAIERRLTIVLRVAQQTLENRRRFDFVVFSPQGDEKFWSPASPVGRDLH